MDLPFEVHEEIRRLVPNLSEEIISSLVTVIEEAGVQNKEDLEHLNEEDLTTVCTKITARVLLKGWKGDQIFVT